MLNDVVGSAWLNPGRFLFFIGSCSVLYQTLSTNYRCRVKTGIDDTITVHIRLARDFQDAQQALFIYKLDNIYALCTVLFFYLMRVEHMLFCQAVLLSCQIQGDSPLQENT